MTKDNFSFKMEKTKYTHSNLHILVAGIFLSVQKSLIMTTTFLFYHKHGIMRCHNNLNPVSYSQKRTFNLILILPVIHFKHSTPGNSQTPGSQRSRCYFSSRLQSPSAISTLPAINKTTV